MFSNLASILKPRSVRQHTLRHPSLLLLLDASTAGVDAGLSVNGSSTRRLPGRFWKVGTHEIERLALAPQGKRHWKMMPYKDTLSVACGWWCTPFTRTTLACHDQHVQRSLGMSSLLSLFHFARGQPWAKTVPAAASPPGARLPERYGFWPRAKAL